MTRELAKTVAKRLRTARINAGLTQDDAAEALGMSRSGYAQIETAVNMLGIEYLAKASEAMGQPVTYFLGLPSPDGLTDDEAELVELYRGAPDDVRNAVMDVARGAARRLRAQARGDASPVDPQTLQG